MSKKSKSDSDILQEARDRFRFAYESDADQRLQERDDLKFQIPENQWTDQAKTDRKNRPIISISQIDQPIQLMVNQERAAKMGVNVHPLTDDADDETAAVIQGLYRCIERDSNAEQARSWAYGRAVKCGRGYWRVNTAYDDAGGNPFDQKIIIEQIYYQDSVLWDPAATKPDRSDAEYCFVETWVDEDSYRRQWPHADPATGPLEIETMNQEAPGWTTTLAGKRTYRIVEYIYKEHTAEKIVMGVDGRVMAEADVPEGTALMMDPRDPEKVLSRTRDKVTILSCKLSGTEVLAKEELNGRYIPIITMIGRELHPFDGTRSYVGIINHAKDSQRFFNYSASTYIERMAMEPKAPVVGYVGQFEGLEEQWDQINTRNLPRLEVNPVVDPISKQVLPLPQRMQIDLTGTSLAGNALSIARDMVQSATAVYDATLGKQDQGRQSGKAIQSLQNQTDAATSDFLHNLADAMEYEARVVIDLLPAIYDRPGRVASIIHGDNDDAELVMLNQKFVKHPVTGRPTAILETQPVAASSTPMPMAAPPPAPRHFDLTKGIYSTSVTIGKSFQSRLDQASTEIGQILQSDPNLMPMIGDLYFRFRDFPGAKEIADRLAKVRERNMPGIGEGEHGTPPPEQAAAQIEALKQQLAQMGQQLQGASMQIQTDQAKQQAQVQIAQLKAETDLAIERMRNAAKIEAARISAAKGPLDEARAAEEEAIAFAREERLQTEARTHEAHQAAQDRAHELAMAVVEHGHATQHKVADRQAKKDEQQFGAAHELAMRETEPKEPTNETGGVE